MWTLKIIAGGPSCALRGCAVTSPQFKETVRVTEELQTASSLQLGCKLYQLYN